MQYFYEPWVLYLIRSDSAFLRAVGIKPCLLDDPCPEPPPEELVRLWETTHVRARDLRVRITEKDARWLKACGVAWEPEPAIQLPWNSASAPAPARRPHRRARWSKRGSWKRADREKATARTQRNDRTGKGRAADYASRTVRQGLHAEQSAPRDAVGGAA